MGTSRLERYAPLAGALFTVLFAVGFLTTGDTPEVDAPVAKIMDHYDDKAPILIGVIMLLVGAVLFMFFAGALRRHLANVGSDWLANVSLAGAAVYAVGLGQFMSSQISLVDVADKHLNDAAVALNVVDSDNFGPAVVGLTIVALATGWHALSTKSLPMWLGWVGLIIGIAGMAGPAGFVAFLAFPIWVLLVAVYLYRAQPAA